MLSSPFPQDHKSELGFVLCRAHCCYGRDRICYVIEFGGTIAIFVLVVVSRSMGERLKIYEENMGEGSLSQTSNIEKRDR